MEVLEHHRRCDAPIRHIDAKRPALGLDRPPRALSGTEQVSCMREECVTIAGEPHTVDVAREQHGPNVAL